MASQNESVRASSRNLEVLLEWALRCGFTRDQFGYAIDRVGSNPQDVASELRRHLSMASLREDRTDKSGCA